MFLMPNRRHVLKAGISSGVSVGLSRLESFAACGLPAVQLPRLFQVRLGLEGLDIRHVLYHKQGFKAPPDGRLQLELSDTHPSYEDRCLWFWGGHHQRKLVRYDPAVGKTEARAVPGEPLSSAQRVPKHVYPVSKAGKVYLIDLADPCRELAIYEIAERKLSFAPLPNADSPMLIVTSLVPQRGPYLYFFVETTPPDRHERKGGVIQWDTGRDIGRLIDYPYPGPAPGFGTIAPDEDVFWSPVWDGNALARFDMRKATWTGYWPTPFEAETQPTSAGLIGDQYYCPDLFKPRLLRFDVRQTKWMDAIAVPGHVKDFGVLGGGFVYGAKMYCAQATLKSYIPPGGAIGVDGKPWHFLDRLLCYDPQSARFAHLVCRGERNEYWLTYAGVLLGKHLYLIAFNARQRSGDIDQFGTGQAAIFQTHPPGRPELDPVLEQVPFGDALLP